MLVSNITIVCVKPHLSVPVEVLSDDVRVPKTCLEGIWCKAANLLKAEGGIVSAHGDKPNSKLVLSYWGNLVEPKNTGIFSCDTDCPNWKSKWEYVHIV